MSGSTHILVFLKAPEPNSVKTRLANAIGSKEAVTVYKKLVERQLSIFTAENPIEIHFAPHDAKDSMTTWLGDNYEYFPQCSGDLGQRLQSGILRAFESGAKNVIAIGGDCPNLQLQEIQAAKYFLNNSTDLVFGPTEDGGYYLIGLSAPHTSLFEKIPWSSEHTLKASLKVATAKKLNIAMLNTLYDIDTVEDYQRALREGHIN